MGSTPHEGPRPLTSARNDVPMRVAEVRLDAADAAWLSAVGLTEGVVLTVLRRAPFGGPLHVATSLGGELALGAQVCEGIFVEEVA